MILLEEWLKDAGSIIVPDSAVIKEIELCENKLLIYGVNKSGNVKITIADNGQSCCEKRYFTCDDDLKSHLNETLMFICLNKFVDISGKYHPHDLAFVQIQTNKDSFSICAHNEHNGFYGGFGIEVKVEQEE